MRSLWCINLESAKKSYVWPEAAAAFSELSLVRLKPPGSSWFWASTEISSEETDAEDKNDIYN